MRFEYIQYKKHGTLNFFSKGIFNKEQITKLFEVHNPKNLNDYLLKLTNKVIKNKELEQSIRKYVYKRVLFLREKARKLYTKVIETAYYQLNSDNFTELKNKEFITLFNKEKQYYKFEAQLNNQYIILMNAPSFDSLFDCTNFYNSIIKNPDINDTNYRIKLPYYVNKNKKSNNISLNKEIYLYKALIDIAKTQFKINIKDEPLKFYENLYYIIENLDENTLINIIKKVHKNNNKNDINANNETIGYELKQCMNDIEKIKKEFPNIKFKNL